ncbi:Glypican-6 [Melipona quadrifasciata]|uniref:Glypican-6 n=1 Tax=Melipona quadrifasciata TaxID=166423 RepID=A0A0N0BKF6_9HYME|nr:Glypican-6 [Melipona quadrifasciata]
MQTIHFKVQWNCLQNEDYVGPRAVNRLVLTIESKELKVCGSVRSGGEVCCSADMEAIIKLTPDTQLNRTLRRRLIQSRVLIINLNSEMPADNFILKNGETFVQNTFFIFPLKRYFLRSKFYFYYDDFRNKYIEKLDSQKSERVALICKKTPDSSKLDYYVGEPFDKPFGLFVLFAGFFRDLLANSKKVFHEMFKKTYGILYEQNSFVFTDLFKELENYYTKGTVDLDDTMDNFFNTLYQKMFTVLNSQYNFDNKYLECVGEHMKEIRPFGDVPQKLGVQIKRSFVATRAFSQALTVAADVLKNMQSLKPSADCAAALTRMTVCPSCSGITGNVLACGDMCANVMKGCLAQHAALDAEWNHFVEISVPEI